MSKESKKSPKKKTLQKSFTIDVIPITLSGDQKDEAEKSIKKHGFAVFQIVEIDSTPDVCTTKTVHR